ncbi:hypothetical protein QVD17_07738 [Tagetes erecta]|uniref:Uncharacterized protein n=1 Tax=Tagetes erecta TaxID=13708 RepID=A0AAD8P473_TARER|nr:hypothetical protein QVD17_07738 [Tagetes erecta]
MMRVISSNNITNFPEDEADDKNACAKLLQSVCIFKSLCTCSFKPNITQKQIKWKPSAAEICDVPIHRSSLLWK